MLIVICTFREEEKLPKIWPSHTCRKISKKITPVGLQELPFDYSVLVLLYPANNRQDPAGLWCISFHWILHYMMTGPWVCGHGSAVQRNWGSRGEEQDAHVLLLPSLSFIQVGKNKTNIFFSISWGSPQTTSLVDASKFFWRQICISLKKKTFVFLWGCLITAGSIFFSPSSELQVNCLACCPCAKAQRSPTKETEQVSNKQTRITTNKQTNNNNYRGQ